MVVFSSSPAVELLPPPDFVLNPRDWCSGVPRATHTGLEESAFLPVSPNRIKHFNATLVPRPPQHAKHSDSDLGPGCPHWSSWGMGQFVVDYLCSCLTPSFSLESGSSFRDHYHQQYMDAVFKLHSIIEVIGRMPDGSPPACIFQALYHLRRLFPHGLIAARDFRGEVATTLILRVFALGISLANQAIYEQRNYNLDWEEFCDIPEVHVDAFELAGVYALNGEVFDLAYDPSMYLLWLDHLGYYAELRYGCSGQVYLRSAADVIAFARAEAFQLPRHIERRHTLPLDLTCLQTLSTSLCWETGVTPLSPAATRPSEFASRTHPINGSRPTATDVLEDVANEYTRLLYALFI